MVKELWRWGRVWAQSGDAKAEAEVQAAATSRADNPGLIGATASGRYLSIGEETIDLARSVDYFRQAIELDQALRSAGPVCPKPTLPRPGTAGHP